MCSDFRSIGKQSGNRGVSPAEENEGFGGKDTVIMCVQQRELIQHDCRIQRQGLKTVGVNLLTQCHSRRVAFSHTQLKERSTC